MAKFLRPPHIEMTLGSAMNPQSIVSGSLGKGNLGDEALLDTYLKQHSSDYRTIAVLREDHRTGPVKLGP